MNLMCLSFHLRMSLYSRIRLRELDVLKHSLSEELVLKDSTQAA